MNISNKALWYIESHLAGGDLSLVAIADACGVSPFHLSRAFPAATGLPLGGYARGRRLTEAAKALATGAPDILTLALDAGYGSHEAFTRAFRTQFGMTPQEVRERASAAELTVQEAISMTTSKAGTAPAQPVRIEQKDAILIFGLSQRHAASNSGIPAQWGRFVPYLGTIRNQTGDATYGVVCNTDGESAGCDYICGVEVTSFPDEPAHFTRLRIPPQTYAVFEHQGHVSGVSETWASIWNQALPEAGLRAADGPSFERYGTRFDGRTGLGGFEIWIPVLAVIAAT